MVRSKSLSFSTKGEAQVLDITAELEEALDAFGLREGIFCVFVPGSTAALTTIEAEPGAISDLRACIERIAPRDIPYAHDARWGDGNGFSHVRAALLGPSLSLPVNEGRLQRGTWQQIVLIDFDNRPRTRQVLCTAVGD